MLRVLSVVGARPNFMKIAPLIREMSKRPSDFHSMLVHTGQHYDANMSAVFFDELGLPRPDVNLEVGSASHARQTADVMMRFEPVMVEYQPDWVLVPGDVNSTLACALVATKLGVRVAHVEAGLRSFDRTMPEEVNRVLTDHIADLLLTPSRDGNDNLAREGIEADRVSFVGNVMIDTLARLLPEALSRWPALRAQHGLREFVLVTLHRPSNVDVPAVLTNVMEGLSRVAKDIPVIFTVHPRTRHRLEELGIEPGVAGLRLLEPPGYLDFLTLQAKARVVLTDSGGVQEETTFLGVPCLTLRRNTERPITIREGTNRLVAAEASAIVDAVREVSSGDARVPSRPELWDGHAAERIVAVLRVKSGLAR